MSKWKWTQKYVLIKRLNTGTSSMQGLTHFYNKYIDSNCNVYLDMRTDQVIE